MMTVTENAKNYLADALVNVREASEEQQDACFRIVQGEDEKLAVVLGKPDAADQAVEHNDDTVLVVEEKIAELISDKTLDVEPTANGQMLTLK